MTPRETVARAIYMTHWKLPEEGKQSQERLPPTWENTSQAVRDWVLKQADSAIEAMKAIDVARRDRAA